MKNPKTFLEIINTEDDQDLRVERALISVNIEIDDQIAKREQMVSSITQLGAIDIRREKLNREREYNETVSNLDLLEQNPTKYLSKVITATNMLDQATGKEKEMEVNISILKKEITKLEKLREVYTDGKKKAKK